MGRLTDTLPLLTAPPPLSVTFAEDFPGAGLRLVEPWWPGRLGISGRLLDLARRGELRCAWLVDPPAGISVEPLTLRFEVTNATATYREVRPVDAGLWQRDVYEFDCVACSREID